MDPILNLTVGADPTSWFLKDAEYGVLAGQLSQGGVMVLPLGPHAGPQNLVRLTKTADGTRQEELIAVRFVPLLPGQAREL